MFMGAIQSKNVRKAQPEESQKELVSNFFIELLAKGYPLINKVQLQQWGLFLVAKYSSQESCSAALAYFRGLAAKKDAYLLFNQAMLINLQAEQIWLLNEKSLEFFSLLHRTNKAIYDALILKLKALCQVNKVFLNGHHLDTVIAAINQQRSLTPDVLKCVTSYLKEAPVDYKKTLQYLRLTHGPELDIRAQATQKLHHAAPHALEIRERTMLALEALHLFPESEVYSAFFKEVIAFMIEFHDEEQINKGSFMSVEEATVAHLLEWLNKALDLESRPQLQALLAFIANRVIVLGTTMVFSPIHTIDLSELYFLMEESALKAELFVADSSNFVLNNILKATMLMTGICDKNPVSLPLVVERQANDAETTTHSLLTKYLNAPLLIERFFTTASFKPYFNAQGPCSAVDYQAFFMTLVPHLSMCTELSVKAKPGLAANLISFVSDCRQKHHSLNTRDFALWYKGAFSARQMFAVVDELFFTAISGEVSFSRSQLTGLESACARLKQFKFIEEADVRFVDIHAPERDAQNLIAFDSFYKALDKERKKTLLKELLLALVVQAGAIYVKQADKGYGLDVDASPISGASYAGLRLFSPTSKVGLDVEEEGIEFELK